MPDPKLALPVRSELRHGKYVVVDAHGKRVAGSEVMDDEHEASDLAGSINETWKRAEMERRAKGSPKVTESRLEQKLGELEEFSLGRRAVHVDFDPRQHPHDRLGRFTEVIGRLQQGGHGSTAKLPHGVEVRKALVGFEVSHPGGKQRMTSSAGAAVEALGHLDAGEIADGADPDLMFRQRMGELRKARRGAMQGLASDVPHIEGLMRTERQRRSERIGRVHIPTHRGRTATSKEGYAKAHPRPDMTTLLRNTNEITAAMNRTGQRLPA